MNKPFVLEDYLKDERNENFKNFIDTINDYSKNLMVYLFDIIKLYKMDNNSYYACGYFVSVPKDKIDYEEIKNIYGEDVMIMLKRLNKVGFQTSIESDLEYVRNMFMGMAQDLRVLIILLGYNLYRAEHLEEMEAEEQTKFVRMVRDIYAPLSARLGLRDIKNKMENISFKFFDPEIYEQLSNDDRLNKQERLAQISATIKNIKSVLTEKNVKCEVYGREKHLASVYNKIKQKNATLSQIYDLMAIRVIVSTVEECYLVLGIVNSMFTIVPNRFKDYIASPKPNGYKSIHTCILSSNNRPIEVQIRTQEMHQFNEYGVAAHWIYKDKTHKKSSLDESINWLKQIIDENKDLSSKEFVETISRDMFTSEIFAQTPNGKIIKFPSGANCIDFAYAIHSDIGNRCVGAKINGKIVPIVTSLQNGDVCEIILGANNKGPSRDWLNMVKTAGARSKINSYFKKQFVEENMRIGKSAMESYAKNMGYNLSDLTSSEKLPQLLDRYNLETIDELYSLVGNASLRAENIVNKLVSVKKSNNVKVQSTTTKKNNSKILVGKQRDMLTHFAKCCMPVMCDEIIGFCSNGRGVTIHRKDCPNVKHLDKNRLLEVEWEKDIVDDYQVRMKIVFAEKSSIIKVASVLEKLNIKVVALGTNPTNPKEIIVTVIVKVREDIEKIKNKFLQDEEIVHCARF